MSTKIDKSKASTIFDDDDLLVMAAGAGAGAGSGGGGSGNQGSGIGGGGGSPGGGNPGGGGGNGGGGGKPGGESVGNNLSFPAIFFDDGPVLRGVEGAFTFTTPTYLTGVSDQVYFAQKVDGNEWQAGNIPGSGPITVDYVDIGDALESAPLKTGTNIRLELSMYETLDSPLAAFAMELLGGAKGTGKPTVKGPTENQGAVLPDGSWNGNPINDTVGNRGDLLDFTWFESDYASIYAAESTGGETADSYMSMSIQKVTGLAPDAAITEAMGLAWNGSQWVDTNGVGDGITVGENIVNTAFGPELNIGGKYIMGASGKPFKFTSDGNYLITFALADGTPVSFDGATTLVANDGEEDALGFQPVEVGGRNTQVVSDGDMSYLGGDTHNGLLVMLVGIPSTGDSGGGEES